MLLKMGSDFLRSFGLTQPYNPIKLNQVSEVDKVQTNLTPT